MLALTALSIQGCVVASDEQPPPTRTPIVRSARSTSAADTPAGPPTTPDLFAQRPASPTGAPARPTAPDGTPVRTTVVSTTTAPPATGSITPPTTAATSRYTVREGDTLSGLSRQYGVSVTELAQVNGIPPDAKLRTGQTLQLPAGTWSAERRIRVTQPASGATVRSPIVVEGTASTFESTIIIELLDAAASSPLARANVRVANADVGQHGPFRVELAAPASLNGRSAVVRVYWTSPRDGSPLDEIRVPVTIAASG